MLFPRYFCRINKYVVKCKTEFDCLFNEKIQRSFNFSVSTVGEMIQENVEIITKTNEFPRSEHKKQIKKRKKRAKKNF